MVYDAEEIEAILVAGAIINCIRNVVWDVILEGNFSNNCVSVQGNEYIKEGINSWWSKGATIDNLGGEKCIM